MKTLVQNHFLTHNNINKSFITQSLLRLGLLLFLLPLAMTAWAHDTHYGKATLVNATGNGTVYLSTASGSNSGQTGSSTPAAVNGTSYITWNCNASSDNDSKTYYARGTANNGYYYAGYATSNTATTYTAAATGKSFTTTSTTEGSPTETKIYGFFKPVTIPSVATPSPNHFDATNTATTCSDYAGTVVFTTANADAIADFKTPTITDKSGNGIYTITNQTYSANKVTVSYQFTGNGTYGGTNRSNSATITLTSAGGESTLTSTAITASFPNAKILSGSAEEIYTTFKTSDATQAGVQKTAVFDVECVDGTDNFDTPSITGTNASFFTYNSMSYADGKLTINYTYNGSKTAGDHTATLKLKVKDVIGGTDATYGSKSVTIVAHNEQEATNDVSVTTAAGVTTEYATFAAGLTAANASAGCTLKLLRNIDLGTITATNNISKAMTIDLNGKELRAAVNATSVGVLTITAAVAVTIKDSKTGGKIINEIASNSEIRTIFVNKASATLTLESGTIAVNNLGQYASAAATVNGVAVAKYANCAARAIHQIAGSTVNINGGKIEAYGTRSVFGIVQASSVATNKASTTVLNITGGEIYAEAPYGAYGLQGYGKVNFSGGNINVKANTNMVDARYAADNANNKYNGQIYGILISAYANATAASCYYGTLNMTGGNINVTNERVGGYDRKSYGVLIDCANANMGANTAVDGSKCQKAAAKGSINGGTITVNSGTYYSFGVYMSGSYNSYDNTSHVLTVKNCTIDVKAHTYAYGVFSQGAVNGTNGGCYHGDIELTNCDVTAETTVGAYSYAAFVTSRVATIYKNASADAANYYHGEYGSAGQLTINSGTYKAYSKTTTAYCVSAGNEWSGEARARTVYADETNVALTQHLGGSVEAYPTLIIHGGDFYAETFGTTTARAVSSGGYTTIDGGTFKAVAKTNNAYGLVAVSGTMKATGVKVEAEGNATVYGVLVNAGISDYTLFEYSAEAELNNLDVTATTRTGTEARGVSVVTSTKTQTEATKETLKTNGTKEGATSTQKNNYNNYYNIYQIGERAVAAKVKINGGTYRATAATTTAYGALITTTAVSTTGLAHASAEGDIKNAKFVVKTNGTTTAYGIWAGGPTTIDGCDIIVQPKTTTAYGIYANDQKTIVTNTKIDVKGTATAYGIYANAQISGIGWDLHGELELGKGNDVTVAATSGNTSHAMTLIAAKKNIASGNFAGDHAVAAKAQVTGGSYKATATGTTSYVLNLSAQQVQGSAIAQPECTIEDGKFWAKATGGTDGIVTTNGQIGSIVFNGGIYNVNTNMPAYVAEDKELATLATTRAEYTEGYRYEIVDAGASGQYVCQISSTKYKTLAEALQVVTSGQTIYMIADHTVAEGDYILPAGATLLVPYKTGSGAGATTAIGNSAATTTSGTTPSRFRKLSFASGANLICKGTIETSAQQKANGQYGANVGMPSGPYGQIHLQEGSHISLESGARLNCWGYITGKGTIEAKKGSTSLEGFQMGDWCGGTNASNLIDNDQKVFPVTHYFYQSIECPITYRPGSRALGSTHINVSVVGVVGQDAIALVGTTGSMFLMDDNDVSADTWVMKDYDETTDQCVWTVNSGASIGNLSINISAGWTSYNMASANYDLPITTNMSIVLNYGEMEIGQNTVFLPGSKLIVNKEGTAVLKGVTSVVYDATDWAGTTIYRATYSPTWGTTNPRSTTPVDAEFFLHGKVDIRNNGGLYTTASGANIHSTNADAGEVIYTTAAQGNKTSYYLRQGGTTKTALTVNPAKLKNGNGTYAASAGTVAGKTWTYIDDTWQCWSKDGCKFRDAQDHPYAKPAALVELSSGTADANHLYYDAATSSRKFVWDADCYWWEVETTPTAEGYYKSINADNNGKYNYYEYNSTAGCWQVKTITVTWNINGTNTNYSVGYGTQPQWLGATPSKTTSSSDFVYMWDGWTDNNSVLYSNDELPVVKANTTFTAHFYEKYYQYNIVFKNSDGTVLDARNWNKGSTPSYSGTPEKAPTVSEVYEFDGTWTPAIAKVTGPAEYVANYTTSPRPYTVTFYDFDAVTVKESKKVAYNTAPTYTGSEPERIGTSAFSYQFAGWKLQSTGATYAVGATLPKVTGEQNYIAQYNQVEKKYRVTFWNEDGTAELWHKDYLFEATPAYGGTPATPIKTATPEYSYTFNGWAKTIGGTKLAALETVEGDQNYYALFTATKQKYTITWKNEDGTTLKSSLVEYGTTPTYNGETPTKKADATNVYTHSGWTPTVGAVTGEQTYTATYSTTPTVASVTINGTATYYATIDAAFDAANASATYEPTITLLRDATTTTSMISYTGAKNCTLNLNGHTLSSTTAQALLYINKEGITFTITDLTESKSGALHLESTSTDNRWCVYVAQGNLRMDAGTISLHSKANQFNEGVRIDPVASTFTMNGGKVHVVTSDNKPAWGIDSRGKAVINDGDIQVEASGTGYGIEARVKDSNIGNVTVTGGKFLVTGATAACVYRSDNKATLKLQGGYYNTNTNLAANCATNYHALPLTSGAEYEAGYLYEVAEAYTVTFNANGHGTAPATQTIKKGGKATEPDAPTAEGYTFGGWYKEEGCTNAWTFSADVVNAATTLYAKWTPITYTISYDLAGGSVASANQTSYTIESAAITLNDPTREGYTFAGWTGTDLGSATTPVTIAKGSTGDRTYSATWTPIDYTISYDLDGGSVSPANPTSYNIETATFTLINPTRDGYTFTGWTGTGLGSATASVSIAVGSTGDKSFAATWLANDIGSYVDIIDWNGTEVSINLNDFDATATGTVVCGSNVVDKSTADNGILTLISTSSTPDETVMIQVNDADGNLESMHSYVVPHVFNADATLGSVQPTSVVFVRSGKLTVDADKIVDAIYVAPDAELVIKSGKTLTVNKLVMRTRAFHPSVLTNNGTLEATKMYYSRIVETNKSLYPFGLPFNSDLTKAILSNGKTAKRGTDFAIQAYNGARRATEGIGGNWVNKKVNELKADTGYQFLSAKNYYREYYFPVIYSKPDTDLSVAVMAHTSSNAGDAGWNFITSPYAGIYTCKYDGIDDPSERIKICMLDEDNTTYYQVTPDNIKPALPFFYQAASSGDLGFPTNGSFAKRAPAANPMAAKQTQWIKLLYSTAEGTAQDQTNIYLHPSKFSVDYELGYDVVKMSKSGSRPFVWSSLSCGDLAFAALPDTVVVQQRIPVAVYAPQAGEMTFMLDYNDYLDRLSDIYLYDTETGNVANLLYEDYTYYAEQGQQQGRFFLQPVFRKPGVVTDIVNTDESGSVVITTENKNIRLDNIGKDVRIMCFDATGRLIAMSNGEQSLTLTVPAAGVYMIKIGNKVEKVVIR